MDLFLILFAASPGPYARTIFEFLKNIMPNKGAELDHTCLLLNINRKAYMGSPLVRLHLSSVILKGKYQSHSDFESLYLVKTS